MTRGMEEGVRNPAQLGVKLMMRQPSLLVAAQMLLVARREVMEKWRQQGWKHSKVIPIDTSFNCKL